LNADFHNSIDQSEFDAYAFLLNRFPNQLLRFSPAAGRVSFDTSFDNTFPLEAPSLIGTLEGPADSFLGSGGGPWCWYPLPCR
jgi:hypothetical protein